MAGMAPPSGESSTGVLIRPNARRNAVASEPTSNIFPKVSFLQFIVPCNFLSGKTLHLLSSSRVETRVAVRTS
jgi:hypothetical protein